MSSKYVFSRILRDREGSVHMLETMIVGLMVVGAVLAVSTFDSTDPDPDRSQLPQDHGETEDIIRNLKALPSTNESLHFTNLLEERLVQTLREENTLLEDHIRQRGGGDSYRLILQHEENETAVLGPLEAPHTVPSTGTTDYVSKLGTTILQPTMSQFTPNTPIHVQSLPTWINRIPVPNGDHYQVDLTIEVDDPLKDEPVIHTHTTQHSYRTPHPWHNPPLISFHETYQGDARTKYTEAELLTPTGYNWTIQARLQASHPERGGPWLHDEDILRIHVPPKWDRPVLEAAGQWENLSDSTDHVLRLKYQGPPLRGDDEGWLNFTLTRPLTKPLLHHEAVTVQQETRTWSQATLVATPSNPTMHLPITVYPSQPNPFPHNVSESDPKLRLTVVNPTPHEATLTHFKVMFPAGYRVNGDASGWLHEYDDSAHPSNYTYTDRPTIGPYGAVELVLPVEARQEDGSHVRHPMPPLIDHEVPAAKPYHREFSSHPQGPWGVYESFLSPDSGTGLDDPFSLFVKGHLPHQIPPGTGEYHYSSLADPVVEELQRARSTMQIHSDPFHAGLDDPIWVSLNTGELLPVLRELPDVEEDRVKVKIQAGSLFSHLIEDPDMEHEFDLGLAWGAGIVGLEWIPRTGGGHDLLVGYSDGHAVLLDGTELPESTLWRERLGKSLVAGPFLVGEPEQNHVVFFGTGSLMEMDLESQNIESLPLPGIVHEVIPVDCLDSGHAVGILTSMTHAQVDQGQSVYSSMDLGIYRDSGYEQLGSVRDVGPVSLESGVFGGECSLVAGFEDADGMGLVKRFPASGSPSWTLEIPGGLQGALVVEQASGDDGLVVVTREFGWFTSDGVSRDRAQPVVLSERAEWVLGDELIGLSWVTPSTGYAVTKMGFVWETSDGGASWAPWEERRVVDTIQRELVDFAFGGNGDALFLRDDGVVREYHEGELAQNSTKWRDIPRLNVVHGLVETERGPAVLGVRDNLDRTGIYVWDFNNHRPVVNEQAVHEVECICESGASGHARGIVAWNKTHVHANATGYPEWNRPVGAQVYAVEPEGHLLSLKEDQGDWHLVKERDDGDAKLRLSQEMKDRLNSNLNASRNPTGAYLHYDSLDQSGLVTLMGGEFRHRSAPSSGLVGLSGGPGGPWWVLKDRLQRIHQGDHFQFQARTSGYADGEQVTLRLESPDGGDQVHWRVKGSSSWSNLGQSLQTTWTDSLLVEVDSSQNPDWVLQEPGLTLVVSPDEGEIKHLSIQNLDCSSCLVSLANDQYVDGGWHWAPEGGLPASDGEFTSEARPVIAQKNGGSFLLGGSELERYWSHDVGLGLPLRELPIPTKSDSGAMMSFHAIPTPNGDDLVLGERGDGEGFLPEGRLGPGAGVASVLYELDPVSGAVVCEDALDRNSGVNLAHGVHDLDSSLVVLGSKWGELTGRDASSCGMEWDHAGLEVGSRLNVELPPPGRGWQRGPVILRAELVVELEGQDPVSLYFLDSAYRTPGKTSAPEVVVYRAHLHYWNWEDSWIERPGVRGHPGD